jgi:hypothetical protein
LLSCVVADHVLSQDDGTTRQCTWNLHEAVTNSMVCRLQTTATVMRALAVVYLSLVLVPRAFAGPPGRCTSGSGSGCHTNNSPSLDACDNGDDSCDGDDDDDDSCSGGDDDDDSCSGDDDDSDCDVARHHGHAHRHHALRSELAWAALPIPFALIILRRTRARKRR